MTDVTFVKRIEFTELANRFKLLESKVNNPSVLLSDNTVEQDGIQTGAALKQELKSFFSVRGYSKVFATNNLIKKIIIFFGLLALITATLFYMISNTIEYSSNASSNLVEIKDPETGETPFPAITVCLANLTEDGFKPISSLNDVFIKESPYMCILDKYDQKCTENDFEKITMHFVDFKTDLDCFMFNSVNSKNKEKRLLISNSFGLNTGLIMHFNLPVTTYVFYHASDNMDYPASFEINYQTQPGTQTSVKMSKRTDIRLEKPYSKCRQNIESDTSSFVKEILESGKKYRQDLCIDKCKYSYWMNGSIANNMSIYEFKNSNNESSSICYEKCPLECEKTIYELIETKIFLTDKKMKLLAKTYNIPNVSSDNFLELNFFRATNRYVETRQIVKVTPTDFVSNTGGLLGLFFDLSFYSFFELLIFIFDKISSHFKC
jgi:hypothetical protein